jgi:hypothetical protein
MPIFTAICIFYAFYWPPLLICGFLLAGEAGGCISVLTKLPALEAIRSEKIDSYERKIWARISAGIAGSLVGCGLLGWGLFPISIQGRTFTDLLSLSNARIPSICTPDIALRILVPLAVCIILGFSERALLSFENGFLSYLKKP